MAEDRISEPPELTPEDVKKVQAIIQPGLLPCGGRGVTAKAAADRTMRISGGRRLSVFALARAVDGLPWLAGTLKLACPESDTRCVTHRSTEVTNTVTPAPNRTSTAPGGAVRGGWDAADWVVRTGGPMVTGGGRSKDQSTTTSLPAVDGSGGPQGLTPALSATPVTSDTTGGDNPRPLKGTGVEHRPGGTGAQVSAGQGRWRHTRSALRRRRPSGARWRRALAIAAAVLALTLTIGLTAASCTQLARGLPDRIPDLDLTPGTTTNPQPPSSAAPTTTLDPNATTTTERAICTPSHCPVLDD